MNSHERKLVSEDWEEVGIAFYIHPTIKDGYFVDFNGDQGDDDDDGCYIVHHKDCTEVYDVVFTYDELVSRYCN